MAESTTDLHTKSEERFCEQCVSVKPVTEFRRRSRNGSARLNQCRDCHNRAERRRRAQKRGKRQRRQMATSLTRMKNERSNRRLELVAGVTMAEFGGLEGFMEAWVDYFRHAREIGGLAAFRCFEFVVRVHKYAEDNQPVPSELSDEDLERIFWDDLKKLIEQEPHLAVEAAKRIGWVVIPGADTETTIPRNQMRCDE